MRAWRENLIGTKYGRLAVVKFDGNRGKRRFWQCLCECGKTSYCGSDNLKSGQVRSCGCLQKELALNHHLSHGESAKQTKTKEYRTWADIKSRCYNKKEDSYQYYGGRGITICDRWNTSYECFLLDMGRAPSRKHSIERNDITKNYEPSNCRWATQLEQANNKSNTVRITLNGINKPISDWCRDLNVSRTKVYQRIHKLKWTPELAFSTP